MSPVTLSSLLAFAAIGVSLVAAQDPPAGPAIALYDKHFASPAALPYKVDTDSLTRGSQTGYNICNSTTLNQQSMCQTAYFNNASDFCLWAPATPDKTVGEAEADMVAWCTKPHGTRLIPNGAITGLQLLRTPDYIQLVGFIDQRQINLQANDYGGEMDPHGADLRGNPMGGVVFSDAFNGNSGNYQQVWDWHNFMGGNAFCFRACNPQGANRRAYCENRFDRIGCAYNDPNNATKGVYESCEADNADYVGIYTSNGVVRTYSQPDESLGAITTIPYTARIPASSNCQTLTSSVIFAGLPTGTVSPSSISGSGSLATSRRSSSTGSGSGSGSQPTAAGSTSDGSVLAISGISMLGVVFAALFLA
jgi:hypothetical protein